MKIKAILCIIFLILTNVNWYTKWQGGMFMTRRHFGVIVGGILLLVIAMGISRFAFTPILPYMREDVGFTFQEASYLASSNYIGYFIGALWAGFLYKRRKGILIWSVIINVASVLFMGIIDVFSIWLALRLIAGITGGLIFVLTSSVIMDYLAHQALSKWSGYLFSGIGLGIALSGLFVPFLANRVMWQGAWIGLGILSAVFVIFIHILWRRVEVPNLEKVEKSAETRVTTGFMPWLIVAYGFEGLGYIITGTFLVDIIHHIPELTAYAGYSWVIVGLAAVPSAPVWTLLLEKTSAMTLLVSAYVLQIIGIVLPVFSQTVPSVLVSSFLYGLTFVGIVTLTTAYARQRYPKQSGLVVSLLTSVYAFGQIIGPLFAGKLVAVYEDQLVALAFAGIMVTVALVVLITGRIVTVRQEALT